MTQEQDLHAIMVQTENRKTRVWKRFPGAVELYKEQILPALIRHKKALIVIAGPSGSGKELLAGGLKMEADKAGIDVGYISTSLALNTAKEVPIRNRETGERLVDEHGKQRFLIRPDTPHGYYIHEEFQAGTDLAVTAIDQDMRRDHEKSYLLIAEMVGFPKPFPLGPALPPTPNIMWGVLEYVANFGENGFAIGNNPETEVVEHAASGRAELENASLEDLPRILRKHKLRVDKAITDIRDFRILMGTEKAVTLTNELIDRAMFYLNQHDPEARGMNFFGDYVVESWEDLEAKLRLDPGFRRISRERYMRYAFTKQLGMEGRFLVGTNRYIPEEEIEYSRFSLQEVKIPIPRDPYYI